jgi:hypothetical protein
MKTEVFWDIMPFHLTEVNRFPPKCQLTFSGLHGIISQKMEHFKFYFDLGITTKNLKPEWKYKNYWKYILF